MDTTPILSQGLRFIPVARGDFPCIGERVEILGRWDDSARGMEIRSSSRSEMHGMLIKKPGQTASEHHRFSRDEIRLGRLQMQAMLKREQALAELLQ